MNTDAFAGLGVALITPFKKDLSIDFDSLEKIIHHTLHGGVDYLVVLGTTAETPTLSAEEKQEITSFVRDTVKERVPLVIGIGGNNTAGVIRDIQTRDLQGYSAILSVAPYYNKPTQEGLFRHFKAIADSSPLPIILYNVPGRTGVNMSALTTLKLAESSGNICGIKEASGKLDQSEEILELAPKSFSLISGNDSDTTALMKMGASGVISVLANAFPSQVKTLVEHCKNGNQDLANNCQDKLASIIGPIFEDGNPAGIKAVLSHMGLCSNVLRLPLVPVSKNVESRLINAMALMGE